MMFGERRPVDQDKGALRHYYPWRLFYGITA